MNETVTILGGSFDGVELVLSTSGGDIELDEGVGLLSMLEDECDNADFEIAGLPVEVNYEDGTVVIDGVGPILIDDLMSFMENANEEE